jgi:predicted lipoprotein
MHRFAAVLFGLVFLSAVPAHALTIDEDQAAEPVRKLVAGFIQPAFQRFAENAELAAVAVNAFCEQPGGRTLGSARQAFADSALSFARVEFLRIGPLIQENRLERLLFWPDRRGIALRQVQGVLANADESVTDAANLPAKSVALQGFTALEFLLFGTGSGDMENDAGHRCRFAAAVAENIHAIALELNDEWQDEQGFTSVWTSPGSDNATFRNAEEVVGELLSIPSEAFEIIRDQRLKPVVPEDGKANPKRALFWRSGLTMDFIAAGFEALRAYFETAGIDGLLPEEESWQARSIEFEFNNAEAALSRLNMPIEDILADEERTGDLTYLVILSQSLQSLFGQQLTATLGLSVGFSSLDGD